MAGHDRIALAARNTALVLVTTLVGVYLAKLLFPFFLGAVVAVILDPLVSAGRRVGLARGLTALFLLVALAGGLLVGVTVGLARLSSEVGSLVESGWGEQGLAQVERSWKGLEELLKGEPARQGLGAIAGWTLAVARVVPGAAVAALVSLLSAYLLLRDKERLLTAGTRLLPQRWRADGERTAREMTAGLSGIIRAELLLSLTTATLAVAGLSAVGVRYSWLLGLGAGLLDLVPMVGPSGVFLPMALYLAATGVPGRALGVLAVGAITALVRQVLEPRFLSAGTGLHPLAMLLAVYAGYRLFGPFGLVAGPLAASFGTALFRVAVEPLLD